eukprot:CAMPEP_0115519754 /NCGR_PEP_ID=MMETSP0271-20121206/78603_1 /TAXON_ID=71861 /ORGANISM="Scrippsiella trochoidea, Strain CCMP3099" /LENGTH=99 /DNA_ID=CAMNT_0002950783 /DNA_START=204 /DNA_END=503 /DNA_ORIENTATION=+
MGRSPSEPPSSSNNASESGGPTGGPLAKPPKRSISSKPSASSSSPAGVRSIGSIEEHSEAWSDRKAWRSWRSCRSKLLSSEPMLNVMSNAPAARGFPSA